MELNRLLEIASEKAMCEFCPDCDDGTCFACSKVKGIRNDELREYHAAVSAALRKADEDEQLEREGRLVVLSEPMLPMVEGKNPNDTDVYCPQCGHDLAGGWKNYDPDCEWKLCQCPNCGQSIDDTRVITRAEAEAAFGGGEGD